VTLSTVVGAGPVGLAVVDELHRRGTPVRAVSRSRPAGLPDGAEARAADAGDLDALREVLEGSSVVYGCLGLPYGRWDALPGLQANLVEATAAAGARLVVVENVYMYGRTGGRPMTEDLPHRPVSRKGEIRARMTEELQAADRAGNVRVAMGRASDFYGPGVRYSALGERVVGRAVAGKRAQVLGDPDLPHTYTYVPDIATALVNLGESDDAYGQVWHLPAAETVTTRRMVELIYEAAGHPPRLQPAGKALLRLAGLFDASARESIEMLYEFQEPFVLDDSRYRARFGDHATPLADAARETVRWWEAEGSA
jgi:nucleoside-diphosphate-sugar epimerase